MVTPFKYSVTVICQHCAWIIKKEFYQCRKGTQKGAWCRPTLPMNLTQAFQPMKTYSEVNLPEWQGKGQAVRTSPWNPPHTLKGGKWQLILQDAHCIVIPQELVLRKHEGSSASPSTSPSVVRCGGRGRGGQGLWHKQTASGWSM